MFWSGAKKLFLLHPLSACRWAVTPANLPSQVPGMDHLCLHSKKGTGSSSLYELCDADQPFSLSLLIPQIEG